MTRKSQAPSWRRLPHAGQYAAGSAARMARRIAVVVTIGAQMSCATASTAHVFDNSFAAGSHAYQIQDYRHSARILARRAAAGDARAQTYLGFMYSTGRGLPQNYKAAAHWMRRAANQGIPDAQYLLGLMYDKGQGVEQDFVRAHAWLNLAVAGANREQRDAWKRIRDAVASKMTPEELAMAQNLAFEWRRGSDAQYRPETQ